MPGSKTVYLASAMLNGVLGGPQFTLPTTIYVALSWQPYIDTATGASMAEIAAVDGGEDTGYARVAMANNTTSWPAASWQSGSMSGKANGLAITFPTALLPWGTVLSFYFVTAATNGNTLYGSDLTVSRLVTTGDTASFAPGAIQINED